MRLLCITAWEGLSFPLRHHDLAHHILRCPHIPKGDDKWQRSLTAFIDSRLGRWDLEGSPDVNAALIRRSLTVRCPLDAGGSVCGRALGSWGALHNSRMASSALFCDHCGVGVYGYQALYPVEVGTIAVLGHLVGWGDMPELAIHTGTGTCAGAHFAHTNAITRWTYTAWNWVAVKSNEWNARAGYRAGL